MMHIAHSKAIVNHPQLVYYGMILYNHFYGLYKPSTYVYEWLIIALLTLPIWTFK